MKTIFRKFLGLVLMVGVPLIVASSIFSMIMNSSLLDGFLLLLASAFVLIGVADGVLLLIIIMEIGSKLWKGESLK